MLILSTYAHMNFPMKPCSTYSMTDMAVAGTLVPPCSITLEAKDLKDDLIVLYFSHSGLTLTWKYQAAWSMVELHFVLPSVFWISTWFRIFLWSLTVILLQGPRSATSLISLFAFCFGKTLRGLWLTLW
jgi:hypothetical protein